MKGILSRDNCISKALVVFWFFDSFCKVVRHGFEGLPWEARVSEGVRVGETEVGRSGWVGVSGGQP